jgi:hypothetical protein
MALVERGIKMKGRINKIVMLLIFALLAALLSSVVAQAAYPYGVTNNVLSDKIEQASDGSYKTGKIIVAFKAQPQAITFQSLTQIHFQKAGNYTVYLEIIDENGRQRAIAGPLRVVAKSDDWIHSQIWKWRVVFNAAGTYQFTVRIDKDIVAKYPIRVSK